MTDDRLQQVFDEVDQRRDSLISMLQSIVKIPSVTGDEGAVQDRVEQLFSDRGLTVDRWETTREEIEPYFEHVGDQPRYEGRPNVVGIRSESGSGQSIMLNAHVDTVDPGDASFWTYGPFSGHVDG